MAKKLLDPACTSAEVVRGFLSLPIQGEVDLGQFLTGRLSQIHSGNQTAFSELYIVLRAAEKLSGQENVAAITSPANVQQLVVTKPEERSMNPAIRSKVAQGHIYNSAKAARGNSTQKTIMMDLLVNSQPNKIMDLLEVSIEHVSNLYRPVIENRVNQLLEEIRRDGQSQPQDLHDANELINRTLTQVQQAISTCEANGNLVALRQNFQDALMILAYYYPPATSKPVPEHLSTLINHIEKRTNSVPENKGNELAQLSSKDEIRELMAKAGLNVLEIDELEGANVLKIGLPEEIQALIGEKEDYYCPQIKLPNFAGEDLPFGTVLMNCLVPPVEDQAVAERILSAQLDILDKLSDALGANPSCYYTGIKNKSATPTHELNNRGFRFFFSPQPNKIQAKVNNILDLYQTKPEDKITRRELYSKKVKSRYSIDMGTGQLRLHTALEDVQPIPDGELVFLA
ncbi:MAG: hypothetical protein KJ811_01655 [Candidatus Margulisbacteria bacterium]|nr:hypothetical protein [Candidatus Margulisiibacteriota bacterium]